MSVMNGPQVAARILAILPGQETVTLEAKGVDDTWATGEKWRAARTPANADAMLAANIVVTAKHRNFQLIRQRQTTLPEEQFRLTDAQGVVWIVEHVAAKVTDYVFDCMCLRLR